MPLTVERLRAAIVALAVLVVVIVASALLYGRWRLRHITRDLPGRLGLQIQQSTQGFTLSESNSQGRTLFTLHAARAVKFKSGGRVSLHDVKINLYNPQDNQADTISGNEFEFDPQSQVVRSPAEAQIALHLPSARNGGSGRGADQKIQVTTHGLVFSQKTGIATCDGEVEFETPQASGHALGAEYDSKQGQLLLKSQLVVTANLRGAPATLNAAQAIYNRNNGHVHLEDPRYASPANRGIRHGSARQADILLRPNGSMQQMGARGSVDLRAGTDTRVQSDALQLAMSENNQPQQAQFTGGVQFADGRNGQQTNGRAEQADLRFDNAGHVKNILLEQKVILRQAGAVERNHAERVLTADRLTAALSTHAGQAQMQSAVASGNAVLDAVDNAGEKTSRKTTVVADTLKMQFAANNQMRQLDGTGHTRLRMQAANGDVDSSTGDSLMVTFSPAGETGKTKKSSSAQRVKTAVQTGNVTLQQSAAAKSGRTPQISSATAQRATYNADADTLTLDGNPRVRDGRLQLAANRIVAERAAGKATATGNVQATLGPAATGQTGALLTAAQPVHVIAEQATLIQDGQKAIFSGRARLWQQQDTIEAPVIEFSQQRRTLEAYGNKDCTHCVLSTFAGNAVEMQRKPAAFARPGLFRVLSQRLNYSDAERKAAFQNDVQVFSADGQLTASQVEIFLAPAAKSSVGNSLKAGADRNQDKSFGVEKMAASGKVHVMQPGRTAAGSRLVYTAATGIFVLTGDAGNPPTVNDTERGTVTGKTITFGAQNQAIMVDGAATTKTRIQKE